MKKFFYTHTRQSESIIAHVDYLSLEQKNYFNVRTCENSVIIIKCCTRFSYTEKCWKNIEKFILHTGNDICTVDKTLLIIQIIKIAAFYTKFMYHRVLISSLDYIFWRGGIKHGIVIDYMRTAGQQKPENICSLFAGRFESENSPFYNHQF